MRRECLLSSSSNLRDADLITGASPRGAHDTERWCATRAGNYFVLHRACWQHAENVRGIRHGGASAVGCSGLIALSQSARRIKRSDGTPAGFNIMVKSVRAC